jgi:hypothetical protein
MYITNCLLPNGREVILIIPENKITDEEFDYIVNWFQLIRKGLVATQTSAHPAASDTGAAARGADGCGGRGTKTTD